jgi:hypothetical protein
MRACLGSLPVSGDQLTNATGIQIKLAYPYSAQHSNTFALSLPNHFSTPHSASGMTRVYPYISPAAPDSNLKSYAKCVLPVVAKYWLIVPVKNSMTTTVVAIQKGP